MSADASSTVATNPLPPEAIQDSVDEYLSHSFTDRVSRCVDEVKAFAAEGLRLAEEYYQLTRTLDVLVPDEGYRGYHPDLLVAVLDSVGLGIVHDCLGGVAEKAIDVIGGYVGEDGLERCRKHVEEHLEQTGPPEAKSTPFRLENLERWCDAIEGRVVYEHKRIDALESNRFEGALKDALSAVERSATEEADRDDGAQGSASEVADCPSRTCSHLGRAHHDWLLTCEQRGIPGVVEVMQYLETAEAMEREDGTLSWVDFPDFVATHNWRDPVAVHDLASTTDALIRSRREHREALIANAEDRTLESDPDDRGGQQEKGKGMDEIGDLRVRVEVLERTTDQLLFLLGVVGDSLGDGASRLARVTTGGPS
jgi:hypothetical protein